MRIPLYLLDEKEKARTGDAVYLLFYCWSIRRLSVSLKPVAI